ncbi:MAG: UDP-N-acetylmuramoyl-L-alanyl-D-glutamate--2,6-diaminopimelate ligase [Oscillospiraceae bacterium]|jgi:UDP-N-acetylmuramoyl-L-alanyl-D-glutamate--2,6-diaminopimelate ligase
MRLSSILEGLDYNVLSGSADIEISGIAYDSRKAENGSVFVCLTGASADGHDYIRDAIRNGARAVVVSKDADIPDGAAVIKTANTRYALAHMSDIFFGRPSRELKVIGITGTKGKTTTSYLIKKILEQCGYKTGLIGTIEYITGSNSYPAKNTTPESYELQRLLREMADSGCTAAVMEVSSQGLMMERAACVEFDVGIFTNLSPDHIGPGEHSSFEQYCECKSRLFSMCPTGIFNADDKYASSMISRAAGHVVKFGIINDADVTARGAEACVREGRYGSQFEVCGKELNFKMFLGLPGRFNIYNALAAIAACGALGMLPSDREMMLSRVDIMGRMEFLPAPAGIKIIVDYAHNSASMEELLKTLRAYRPKRLMCLFGCGGARAKSRRYDMGRISGTLADLTIITNDNPRDEEPEEIIKDIEAGIEPTGGNYIVIPDRKDAIRLMLSLLKNGDIAVIAGKGHQLYDEVRGVRQFMDERQIVQSAMRDLGKSPVNV